MANYAVRAAEKLRSQQSLTGCVYVTIQTSRFVNPGYANAKSLPLLHPTNDSRVIVETAVLLCRFLFRGGYAYAKAGVGLLDLVNGEYQQNDLFDAGQSAQSQAMMTTLDTINQRYGQGAAFLGRQGIQRSWAMARALKSPAYTTRVADFPVVRL